MEIYVYGAGNRGRILVNAAKNSSVHIIGIVDSNINMQGTELDGVVVQSPDILREKTNVNICVSFYSTLLHDNVWKELPEKYGIDEGRIYSFNDIMIKIYNDIAIPGKNISEGKKYLFIGDWTMKLGGVESWMRDVVLEFSRRKINDIYLVTDMNKSDYPEEISDRIVDFSYDKTPEYTREYIDRGIDFVIDNLPCKMVFSRVDELLLAAYLVKRKYPEDLDIVMVDHGACDGMCHDIISYSKGIDNYIAVSGGIRKLLIEHGINKDKIEIMTCPISYIDIAREKREKDYIRIGYAGRIEIFEKRMDILLRVLDELEQLEVKYRFEIAGSGTYRNKMEEYIQSNELGDRVCLLGQIDRDEIPYFWNRQDIAVNVSDNEGRPLSNIEAMLYGAVPVVTNTIGSAEDVEDGANGYIVPIGDYHQIAKYIVFLNNNREKLEKMSNNAHVSIAEKMSMDSHMDLWYRILGIAE